MADKEQEKRLAAAESLNWIQPGMRVGLGSGSTAEIMIQLLGEKVRAGLEIRCVPTSEKSGALAQQCGISLVTLDEEPWLDLTIDGADEVNPQLDLIKGGGGNQLREKIAAAVSDRLIIIVDSVKLVQELGAFPVAVEVVPFGLRPVERQLERLGGIPKLRMKDNQPVRSDEGNVILDCKFAGIPDPAELAPQLNNIPGVVEHGLFVGMADIVVIGRGDGVEVLNR